METNDTGIKSYKSDSELSLDERMLELLRTCPIPDAQVLENLGLYLHPKNLSRILFMHQIYQEIVEVPGVVFEYGTRWGQNIALFSAFRGIYEPFNRHRKIVGFDTFAGFPGLTPEDGASDLMREGNLAVTENYGRYLDEILSVQEAMSPLSHIKKFELVVGDATKTTTQYLEDHPETIIALAYFDFDLYEPTRDCLEQIKDRLTKGSVVAFDELNDPDSPGETLALMEVLGLRNVRLKRRAQTSRTAFFVVE